MILILLTNWALVWYLEDKRSFGTILLLGLFSMLYGEVFAGASLLWFFDAWSLLVTFPLYWSHVVFFWSLANRLKRVSLRSLYLFGIIFGLYESWITKVVWSGFMGQEPILGTLFGFAIVESLLILLFWHPIMSFILPLVSVEILYTSIRGEVDEYSHLIIKNKSTTRLLKIIIFASSVALALNSKGNLLISLSAFGGTLLLIYLVFRIQRRNPEKLSLKTAVLGTKSFVFVLIYILGLYTFFFFVLLPERIPPITTILATILLYIIIFGLILLDHNDTNMKTEEILSISDIKSLYKKFTASLIMISLLYLLTPELAFLVFLIAMILMIATGIYTLISVTKRILEQRRKTSSKNER